MTFWKKLALIALITYIIFNEEIILASSRKVSFDIPQTILTDYIELESSSVGSYIRSRRMSSIWEPPAEHNPSIILTEIHLPHPIVEAGINLDPISTINLIKNNDAFRRDNLNNNYHYFVFQKQDNTLKVTKLIEADESSIHEIKQLTIEEIENIKDIEEEIIYNTILYEIPSRTIVISPIINSLTNQISLRQNNLKNSGIFADLNKTSDYGLWITGGSTTGRHIKTKQVDEFKFHSGLATIGFDLLLDERTIVGIVYSLSETKNKFISSSSKENIKVQNLTIYTGSEMNKISMFHSLSSGLINVKNTSDLFYYNQLITSKHNGTVVDFSTSYYKQYSLGDEFITPKITLNYNYIYLKAFKENGVEISKTMEQTGALIPSITIGKTFSKMTPSMHYDLIFHPFYRQKRAKVTILHNNQQLSSVNTSYKPEAHKIGTSIELKTNAAILLINYGYLVEKKSYSHNVGLTFKYQF